MEAKEILGKLKQMFADLTAPPAPAPAPAPMVATEYDITGGGKCTIDKLDVGGLVMIDGNQALPGDLSLTDGTMITVGDNGVITAVTPGAAPAPAPAPTPAGEDMGARFTALESATNERFASYDQKLAAQDAQLAQYKTQLATQTEMINKLLQFGELMVNKPAAQPDPGVRKPQNNFNNVELQYDPALFSEKN